MLDSRDEQGLTGLLWACDRGDVALVSQLLDVGADIQQQDSQGKKEENNFSNNFFVLIVFVFRSNSVALCMCLWTCRSCSSFVGTWRGSQSKGVSTGFHFLCISSL